MQELFFALGNSFTAPTNYDVNSYLFIFSYSCGKLTHSNDVSNFNNSENQEITLPQLRDLVVLKRDDVGDATHTYKDDYKEKYYIGNSVYKWEDSYWEAVSLNETYISGWLKPITNDKEMTWQDALRAVADGKEVVFNNGFVSSDMSSYLKGHFLNCSFSLKPQTIYIDGGDYTKEELLKIAGEME